MKNRLTRNIGLKIGSLFLAIVLWLVVTSINNPTEPRPLYNIPVKLLNTDIITDSGQVYEVLDGTDVIDKVVVRGPRSIVTGLKEENIIATADVSELSSLDTISIKLATNVSGSEITSITGSIDTVRLKIENKRSKALALKATTSGKIEDGYMVGEITMDQNVVRISGPQSVIDQVARATVDVSVTGMVSDIVTNAEIKLYDENDNEITDTSRITQNIRSTGVRVTILQKASVPVRFGVTGRPAAGFRATGEIEGNDAAVEIAGKANAIKNISEIVVPSDVLDITDQEENYSMDVDIRPYLPDNVALANAEDAVCTVTVMIEPEVTKRLEIREERVRITNLPEGYEASISGLEESFIIEVIGLSRDVAGLQASSISGTVDIQEWMRARGLTEPEPGFYTVNVDFGLSEDVALRSPVAVTLHITEKTE